MSGDPENYSHKSAEKIFCAAANQPGNKIIAPKMPKYRTVKLAAEMWAQDGTPV